MFYDGILLSIISKEHATHDIIDEALNYLKLNNKRNAKVLTNIPYLIFKNLDFLANVSSYTLINIKSLPLLRILNASQRNLKSGVKRRRTSATK